MDTVSGYGMIPGWVRKYIVSYELFAIFCRENSIYSRTCHKVLLPGLLVWRVSLSLCAGSESDTWNSVSSHDRYTVGGEGPFVNQRAGLSHLKRLGSADTVVAVEILVGSFQGLGYLVILWDRPGREVALDLIYTSCVGRTIIVVHRYRHIIAVLLDTWQGADLVKAALPGLAECHTAVKRDRAGISNRAAAR